MHEDARWDVEGEEEIDRVEGESRGGIKEENNSFSLLRLQQEERKWEDKLAM